MKHCALPRNAILRDNDQQPVGPVHSPNPSSQKLKPSPPLQSSSRRHNSNKENASPSDLNPMLLSDQKPSSSPAVKLRSPLPPRPPSSNPLKRKLNMETLPENSVLDSGVKVIILAFCSLGNLGSFICLLLGFLVFRLILFLKLVWLVRRRVLIVVYIFMVVFFVRQIK